MSGRCSALGCSSPRLRSGGDGRVQDQAGVQAFLYSAGGLGVCDPGSPAALSLFSEKQTAYL